MTCTECGLSFDRDTYRTHVHGPMRRDPMDIHATLVQQSLILDRASTVDDCLPLDGSARHLATNAQPHRIPPASHRPFVTEVRSGTNPSWSLGHMSSGSQSDQPGGHKSVRSSPAAGGAGISR